MPVHESSSTQCWSLMERYQCWSVLRLPSLHACWQLLGYLLSWLLEVRGGIDSESWS
jgi:hypothetical protein